MSNIWKIVVPESADVTNLVTNPSIEVDATGFTAVGGSVARSSAQQKRGGYSLAVTPTSGTADGAFYGTVSLTSGQSYTSSVDVWGVDTIPYRIYFATTGAVVKGTPTEATGNGDWQRVTVTWTADATASFRLYVVKNSHASTGVFYIDGLLCVNKAYDLLYFDGDSYGCKWSGTHHASTSVADAQTRALGREYAIQDTYGMYIQELQGMGMGPVAHKTLDQALMDGALFRGSKVPPRSFALVGGFRGTSIANLHSQRKSLIDVIKPDRVKDNQPFLMRYYGADSTKPLEIACQFDSETGVIDDIHQAMATRLMAYDPYFYEDGNAAKHVTAMTTVTTNYIAARIDGAWSGLGPPSSGAQITAIASDETYIYIAGAFTNLDGDANADGIARYNKVTGVWSALGTGANDTVRALAIGPDGSLYAGGDFTAMGGVANTAYIARWDGSAWNALGTGMNAAVLALAFDTSGILFAGGSFTTAGGGAAEYIAKWSGSAWSAVGVGLSASVNALVGTPDGSIYAGGAFLTTSGGGTTLNCVGRWYSSTWSALGSGMNNQVRTLAYSASGILTAGGDFTTAGGNTVNYVTSWNGAAWSDLDTGVEDLVYALRYSPDGILYASGQFDTAGSRAIDVPRLAIWNGSTWANVDFKHSVLGIVFAIHFDGSDLYFGSAMNGDTYVSSQTTITNDGSRESFPKYVLKRTGGTSATLQFIRNEDTGDTLWFDYDLLDGETITVDFMPGNRKITSSFFGEVPRAILRGSDFATFKLLPGDNNISVFVYQVGSPTITSYFQWRNRHWSVDGAAA